MNWKKIKLDINGNSRHVCHFVNLLTSAESKARNGYALACGRANKLGGRKYNCKAYGGGIVFPALGYELANLEKRIAELVAREGNNFSSAFDSYACVGDTIEAEIEGFRIVARIECDPDTTIDNDDCHNSDLEGLTTAQKRQIGHARNAWKRDDWFYCGIWLNVYFNGVEIVDDITGPSLWGIECNYPKGENAHLTVVANELLSEALEAARARLGELQNEASQKALDACRALAAAYDNGEENGGSIEWSELDDACELARAVLALLEGGTE